MTSFKSAPLDFLSKDQLSSFRQSKRGHTLLSMTLDYIFKNAIISVTNTIIKTTWGEMALFQFATHRTLLKDAKAGTQDQSLKQ